MTVLVTFLAAWLAVVAAPETPVGRLLRRCLVERPAATVASVTRGHLALAAVFGLVAALVAWIGEADGLRMATMAAPEIATWVTTFEVATWLDVAIGAAAAWGGLRMGRVTLASVIRCPLARRRRRAPRTRARRAADNDDDHAGPRRRVA